MAITPLSVTIDLNPSYKTYLAIPVSQLDNNLRTLAITLQDSGTSYDVQASGYDVYVEGTKPDKRGFSYKVTDIGGTVIGSVVTVPVQTQMTAVKGLVETEIVLKSGDDRIGSANFLLMVEGGGLSDDVDISTSELAPYLAGAQQAAEIATEAAETAENVLNSIPSDYSQLSEDVNDLKGLKISTQITEYTETTYGLAIMDRQNRVLAECDLVGGDSVIFNASQNNAGWMSAQDKVKLDSISLITSEEISEVLEG